MFMQYYLGISFVVVVVALCIAVLSRIVTKSIVDEIDKSRIRRTKAMTEALTPMLKGFVDLMTNLTTGGAKANEEVKATEEEVNYLKTPRKRTVKKTEEKAE